MKVSEEMNSYFIFDLVTFERIKISVLTIIMVAF